jgi:hypothetical protein
MQTNKELIARATIAWMTAGATDPVSIKLRTPGNASSVEGNLVFLRNLFSGRFGHLVCYKIGQDGALTKV